MNAALLLTVYCLLILAASLGGGLLPSLVRLTHTRLQLATSFVAGLMLGVGVLHLLPHAWHQLESIDGTVRWMLGGFLVMFLTQRFFHFHHHDVAAEAPEQEPGAAGHAPDPPGPACAHEHHTTLAEKSALHLSWIGAALGLTLHTLVNGAALAASVAADRHLGLEAGLLGLGTFLVIFLHKPFDAMVITTLMAAGGWSRAARHLVNAAFALVIPAGVVLFHLGFEPDSEAAHLWIGSALAFAAGTFICIATSDLLPELQFHAHDRVKLSVALLLGLGLAVAIGLFESVGHDHHEHEDPPPSISKLAVRRFPFSLPGRGGWVDLRGPLGAAFARELRWAKVRAAGAAALGAGSGRLPGGIKGSIESIRKR